MSVNRRRSYARPVSQVQTLTATSPTSNFLVKWGGTDTGAGVKSYRVSVSTDNGPFVPWLTDTTLTSAVFAGAAKKTYQFKSVAVDNAGSCNIVSVN